MLPNKDTMQDLGVKGESSFSLWCADAGLIANGSQIDKTGWDFFVEFPFESSLSPTSIHNSAFECRVQVKATDKKDRKLPIKLSNLRRLITAQMPAFFVFIEFNGKTNAQNAFIVHVDNNLISKVLKRIHQIEQSDKKNKFNKRTMTIHYSESNQMDNLSGDSLKRIFESHIGNNMANYVKQKKEHLESTGFEKGSTKIKFETKSIDNLEKLMDVSIGIEKQVEISNFRGTYTRFGISSKSPFINSSSSRFEMPDVKPYSKGSVKFKKGKLSSGLTFESKLYISPFNVMVPDKLKKMRIEGDFFNMVFNPFTGSATYTFSFSKELLLEVKKFRDAVKLITLLTTEKNKLFIGLQFENFPELKFKIDTKDQKTDFSKELNALESAVKILEAFNVSEYVDISLDEARKFEEEICQLETLINQQHGVVKTDFSVQEKGFTVSDKTACIFLITAPIGSHVFGVFLTIKGKSKPIENGMYQLITEDSIIEKKIMSKRDETITRTDLIEAVEEIEAKYDDNYTVVSMFKTEK